MPEEKSPVDQALDLLVFAPLGLAMTARTQLPEMVAKGRAQVENQLTMARFIGEFAVKQGRVEVEKRLSTYLGSTPVAEPAPLQAEPEPSTGPAEPQDEPASSVTEPATVDAQPAPAPDDDPDAAASARPDDDHLAIPGYDALSASQVVQRLAGLSSTELEQVRAYETATRGRKTVLTKISQLQ